LNWIRSAEGAKRLEVSRPAFRRIAAAAGIRVRKMPGEGYPRYSSQDVDRVAAESIIPAREPERAVAG
jgi:hypothetical protein